MKELIKNKAFAVGFCVNIFIFVILNYLSFAMARYEYTNREIKLDHDGYSWGFPFELYRNYVSDIRDNTGFTMKGIILDSVLILICGFILGLVFRFAWSKFQAKPLK